MQKLIEEIITNPPYAVDLGVHDYQDEGIKLDIFVWETVTELRTVEALAEGEQTRLMETMYAVEQILVDRGIKTHCNPTIEKY